MASRLHAGVAALAALALTSTASAQTPTFDELVFASAPLDAGGSIDLAMDVYLPPGYDDPRPVVLWIHGGGWNAGSHDQVPEFVFPVLDHGIAIASVEYRYSSQAVFPAQIHDVKAAVRYLRAHAAALRIDPDRIGAWGQSAGGHLAALLGTSAGVTDLEGTVGGNVEQSTRIQCVLDFYGPTDLLNLMPDVTVPPGTRVDHDAPTSPASRLIGFGGAGQGIGYLRNNSASLLPPIPDLLDLTASVSPLTHVTAGDPPMWIAHGADDTSVPFHQSVRLLQALQAQGIEAVFEPVTTTAHGYLGPVPNARARAFLLLHLLDCNANGIQDAEEVALGNETDVDENGVLDGCQPPLGTGFCAGDGSGSPCPCGNESTPGLGEGCLNSFSRGAGLAASGVASVASDSVELRAWGMTRTGHALFLQGDDRQNGGMGMPMADGLLCLAGNLVRLGTKPIVDAHASFGTSPLDPSVAVRGNLPAAGGTYHYQVWYRNSVSFCSPATSNLSNGLTITWQP